MSIISVIIPIYNVEPYLRRCIDSILAQTFSDFELILVDDGSADLCGAICDEYAEKDPRVHVIHQENGGASSARNAGLDWIFANSCSSWISMVDGDDLIHPRFLEILHEAAVQSDAPVSTCRFASFSDHTPIDMDKAAIAATVQNVAFSQYYASADMWSVALWNKLYRRELFRSVRFPVGRVLDDVFVTYRVLYEAKQIAVSSSILYFYYLRDGSAMHRKYHLKYLDGLDACREQLKFFIEKDDPVNAETAFHQLTQSYAEHCRSLAPGDSPEFPAKRRELIRELRQLLRAHRSWVSVKTDAAPMEAAFPKRMWCYWTWQGLRGKFRRKKEH